MSKMPTEYKRPIHPLAREVSAAKTREGKLAALAELEKEKPGSTAMGLIITKLR